MSHPTNHKFLTMTALAVACTTMLATSAIAATDSSTAASDAAATSVPSAVDSSKRTIRRSQPKAVADSTQTNAVPSADQTLMPIAEDSTAETRVYQSGPIDITGVDISAGQLANVPTPQVRIADVSFVPTVLIDQQQTANSGKLDVSLLDDFITEVSPNARHYPPNFPNRTQRHYTREKIKVLTEWIEPYANDSNASYDVLIRAAKLNGMGRNLDLGGDYAVRGGKYVDRAIKNKPDSGEANFIYGMMLSEGGGFKEGQKYLDRAVALGYAEAEQSLAQSDLLSDRRDAALDRLRRLEQQDPNNSVIREQIKLVESGQFYIWDLPAPNINVKPTT